MTVMLNKFIFIFPSPNGNGTTRVHANSPTANSHTGQLADKTTSGQANSQTSQLADN